MLAILQGNTTIYCNDTVMFYGGYIESWTISLFSILSTLDINEHRHSTKEGGANGLKHLVPILDGARLLHF